MCAEHNVKSRRRKTNNKWIILYSSILNSGSGKTTYCHKISEFYKDIDRKVAVVNLDPANEQMSYTASIDIVGPLLSN